MSVYICLAIFWSMFIHLPVVSVRILEAVMQTRMGKVCRGLMLCICSWQCEVWLFLFWFSRRTEFSNLSAGHLIGENNRDLKSTFHGFTGAATVRKINGGADLFLHSLAYFARAIKAPTTVKNIIKNINCEQF